jgi:uncharacterized cupredoxin-like copper-binding protein
MHRRLVPLALLGAVALASCSKDAAKSDSTAVAQTGATTTPVAGYDPAARVVTITANDFSFVAPDTIPSGWTTFRLLNDGPNLHHVQLARLDSGKTVADLQTAVKAPGGKLPKWLVLAGGPNAPDPKSLSNATMNVAPGNYVLICFVDIPDKVPHFAKGMVRPLTVVAGTVAGVEPTADVVITLSDYSFTVTTGALTAGKHVVKIVNNGPQDHEIELLRFAAGKTMKDLGAWAASLQGPPPAGAIGGVANITKGAAAYFDVELTPGNNVFLCFFPDAKDGKPHMEHGMIKEFTIQ